MALSAHFTPLILIENLTFLLTENVPRSLFGMPSPVRSWIASMSFHPSRSSPMHHGTIVATRPNL